LKALTYQPTGGIVAAPTTSLPERIGGVRNWDYRYCWLRDATFTLLAMMNAGFTEEAHAWRNWLLRAVAGDPANAQILYGVGGERRIPELELDWLPGYVGSQPVRIGNAAHEQLQLDIYGELLATVAQYVDSGGELDATERRMVQGLGRSVCQLWRKPDQGIWETRGPARHHTYSKAMCWVALDRLMHLGLGDEAIERERGALRKEIEARGFSERLGGYVGYYGGEDPDAALLLLARHGYHPPQHPRMQGTWRLIRERLSRDGLLQRYPLDSGYDGVSGGENAFAPCTFWAAEYLANLGRLEEAREIFERLLGCANDVGLFAEEIVPGSGEPIGNFPQAFTHVSMISAATALTVEKTA
jgi:GH15 family glucan-1,4-alpha-glucosidase